MNKLRAFLAATEPVLRLYDRESSSLHGPYLYTLEAWEAFAGIDAFIESQMPDGEANDVLFLRRPTKPVFWQLVQAHRLVMLDFLGPAALGLLVKLRAPEPLGVVYDLSAARQAFTASYRDPERISEKRRAHEAERKFRSQVLQRKFQIKGPEFATYVLT